MSLTDDLKATVYNTLHTQWKERESSVVPDPEDLELGNDAVKLNGTVLYADLVESTALVDKQPAWFAAEVYKTYLNCASRIIKSEGGEITAFDGDRVMAVFVGEVKNTPAVRAAMKIKFAVNEIINPAFANRYKDRPYTVRHAVGIDTSPLFVAREGVRGDNDLVWVGRAANYAAKLCTLRYDYYSTWITKAVYDSMNDEVKYADGDKRTGPMWEQDTKLGLTVYKSTYRWHSA